VETGIGEPRSQATSSIPSVTAGEERLIVAPEPSVAKGSGSTGVPAVEVARRLAENEPPAGPPSAPAKNPASVEKKRTPVVKEDLPTSPAAASPAEQRQAQPVSPDPMPKPQTKLVLTPAGEEDFVPFGGGRRRSALYEDARQSGESHGIPRWLEIALGLALLALSLGAVLWTYLNFLLPPIPLRSEVRGGSTVVVWPAEMTDGSSTLTLTVLTGGQSSERAVTAEEQRSGSAVISDPGIDSMVELRMHHWAYSRAGQIRLIQVPPAAPRSGLLLSAPLPTPMHFVLPRPARRAVKAPFSPVPRPVN
jgi:hypothetical protein